MKTFVVARIREIDCIGCTKCIEACPVDAIIGARQLMHTVMVEDCIGCKLCVEPCPVDCIELDVIDAPFYNKDKVKQRARNREQRLAQQEKEKNNTLLQKTLDRQQYLQAAMQRVKTKKGFNHE